MDHLKELISKMGCGMQPKELETFIDFAKDEETGRVFYEDYVAQMCAQVDDHMERSSARPVV